MNELDQCTPLEEAACSGSAARHVYPQRSPGEDPPHKLPPGPRAQVSIDDAHGPQQEPLQFLLNVTRQYGGLVRYETAYGVTYIVNHPDYIAQVFQSNKYPRGSLLKMVLGEGLLASDGPYWHRQRRLMQPNFFPQRLAAFGPLITDATTAMLERWRAVPDRGQPLEIATEMLRLTLEVVVKTLFSDAMSNEANIIGEAMATMMTDIGGFMGTEFTAPLNISPSRNHRFQTSLRAVDSIVCGMIQDRRQDNEEYNDLLSLLLLAGNEPCEGLNDLQVRDEVMTMLLAGSETTSLALGWTWYALSEHPEVERRLYAELAEVLGGRLPTVEDLPRLKYTLNVLQESMRLYPPVWSIFRKALVDGDIGGYYVPAKASVVVSPYAMHRHPDYWKEPERFDPERFTSETSGRRSRYTYLPFGGGQHHCIGNHFALLEAHLIIATVAQHYRLRLVPGHPVEPLPAVTLRQRDGLLMTVEARLAVTTNA